MKKLIQLLSTFLVFVLLTGCPYSSIVSLSPNNRADGAFLEGTWTPVDAYEMAESYTVTKERNSLKIVKTNTSDGTETEYRGYLTKIDDVLFLNTWEASSQESDATFYFHKVEKKGDGEIVLYEVTEYIREVFISSDEIYKYFKDNMKKSYFFATGEVTYVRAD